MVRVIGFDIDGTLVEHDQGLVIWQILNREFGGGCDVNAERSRAFRSGELTYAEWVRLDVEGWQKSGARRDRIVEIIRDELRLVPYAREVTVELARRGYVLIVVSGSLDVVIDTLFPEHPFEQVLTSRIRFGDDGCIEGWTATPFDREGKADALRLFSARTNVPASEFAFVGDHVNDLHALQFVGCPIAYHPKDASLMRIARHVLPRGELRCLLDLFPDRPEQRVRSSLR